MTDDFTLASPGELRVGASAKGNLEMTFDADFFKISLNAATTYLFAMTGATQGGGNVLFYPHSSMLSVLDASGKTLSFGFAGSEFGPIVQFKSPAAGDYLISVHGGQDMLGTYSVAATVQGPDDLPSDASTTGVLEANGTVSAKFEVAGDRDWFKFHAEVGKHYTFEDTNALGEVPPSDIEVYDASGKLLDVPLYPFEVLKTGDYYLEAQSDRAGQYTILSKLIEDDYTSNNTTEGRLSPGVPATGQLQYVFDEDLFKMSMNAGQVYTVELAAGELVQPDLELDLLDNEGYSIVGAEASTTAAGARLITYRPTLSGDYYLDVFSDSLVENRMPATYTLTASSSAPTGDLVAPALIGASPSPDSKAVHPNGRLVLTFSESIKVNPALITLKDGAGAEVPLVHGKPGAIAVANTLTIDPGQYLNLGAAYKFELGAGAVLDLADNPYQGVKSFGFTTVASTETNHYLLAGSNGVTLTGGAGVDTAVYSAARAAYKVTLNSGGATVQALTGQVGDVLVNVERIMFDHETMALDIAGTGGQAYRLYQAAFGRTPDSAGVGYWIAMMDKGASLHNVSHEFVASPEFKSLYGNTVSDAAFIDLLYANVLHRSTDKPGFDYWVDVMHHGLSRESVLEFFSESAENVAGTAAVIGNGFLYTPYG